MANILEKKFTEALSLSNLSQDRRDAISYMKTTYTEFSDYLAQASWVERVETIQVEATYIASIASIAVFLGAVQISFIAYAAPSSSQPNHVQEAINVLSFCALLFDVLGALFALVTSGTLIVRASEAKRFTTTKQDLFDKILKLLNALTDQHNEGHLAFEDSHTPHIKAQRLAHLIDEHSHSYFDVLLVIIAGVIFFFASFFLFIISTQHIRVWLSTIVVVGTTTVMLLYMQTRRHPATFGRAFLEFWKLFLK